MIFFMKFDVSPMDKKNSLLKKEIAQSFNQAAQTYDNAAYLQHEVADRLIERLEYISIKPKLILDLGTGTDICKKIRAIL